MKPGESLKLPSVVVFLIKTIMSTRKAITLAEKLKLISRYEQRKKDKGKVNVANLRLSMECAFLHYT